MCRINVCKITLICALVCITAKFGCSKYENHKIFEIKPRTQESVDVLKTLRTLEGFHFLKPPMSVNKDVIIIVSPSELSKYYNLMFDNNIYYRFLYEDAREWYENPNKTKTKRSIKYGYSYLTLDQIYKQLDDLATKYPSVQIIIGGHSYENRQIKGVKVSFGPNNPGIFIEGGIQGNEWISSSTTLYILHKLLTSVNTNVREMADRHDWYIFPVFNPDGYEYAHASPNNRYWTKTRKPYNDQNNSCIGTNLGKNWDYHWHNDYRRYPCSTQYAGRAPFSEIEAKTMSEYIKTISDKFYAYISIQDNDRYILFPYGYTGEPVDNYNELVTIATAMQDVIKKKHNAIVYVGSISEKYGVTPGSPMDYIRGVYGTRLVYMYQLTHPDGYMVPEKDIIPMGQRTLDSFVAMFKEAKKIQENKQD